MLATDACTDWPPAIDAVAVFPIVPAGVSHFTVAVMVKICDAPGAREEIVVCRGFAPAAHPNEQLLAVSAELSVSTTVMFEAVPPPTLLTLIV